MRCPKCHYLSFDPEPRCKNCGFDLEVADAELAFKAAEEYSDEEPDLKLQPDRSESVSAAPVTLEFVKSVAVAEPPVPIKAEKFRDLVSKDEAHDAPPLVPVLVPIPTEAPVERASIAPAPVPVAKVAPPPAPVQAPVPVPVPVKDVPIAPPMAVAAPSESPTPTGEMPLFVRENAPARPPLAVRRTVTDLPKPKSRVSEPPKMIDRRVGPLDHDLLDDLRRVEREEAAHIRTDTRPLMEARVRAESTAAAILETPVDLDDTAEIPPTLRLAAASFDGLLLGGIGTFVLWAALKLTGAGLTTLPMGSLVPFAVFLIGVAVTYLLMFTAAGGQTLGKMLMGLRVVCDEETSGHRLTLGQAAVRAAVAPFSVLALGLGWVPALFGNGLALHDRLAHTRVVRA